MTTPHVSLVAIGASGAVEHVFVCPIAPETVAHSIPHDGTQPETLSLTFHLDASDALMISEPITAQFGIHPQLALLQQLIAKPWLILAWGASRIVPVEPISANVSEVAFDRELNPIRADITMTMHVIGSSTDPTIAPFVQRAVEKRARLAALVPAAPSPPLE